MAIAHGGGFAADSNFDCATETTTLILLLARHLALSPLGAKPPTTRELSKDRAAAREWLCVRSTLPRARSRISARAAIEGRRDSDPALESAAERGLRPVTDTRGNLRQARIVRAQEARGELNSPLRQVLNGGHAHEMAEAFGQHGARHAHFFGQQIGRA